MCEYKIVCVIDVTTCEVQRQNNWLVLVPYNQNVRPFSMECFYAIKRQQFFCERSVFQHSMTNIWNCRNVHASPNSRVSLCWWGWPCHTFCACITISPVGQMLLQRQLTHFSYQSMGVALTGPHFQRTNSSNTIWYMHCKRITSMLDSTSLQSLVGATTSIRTKHVFCRDKSTPVVTKVLLQQIFVMPNVFIATKVLSQEAYFFCNKTFVMTKLYLSQQIFVMTKVLLRQKYFVGTNRIFSFVATSILLSWQKMCFVATNTCLSWQNYCCDKNYTCGSSCQW